MKTAISIPDRVFTQADRLAKRLGLTRSELYARAVERFVGEHSDSEVTAALNSVYSGAGVAEPEDRSQLRDLPREKW
jgi:metal-responsive CopG/Arc/MetJ family transcriptional regulator